MGITAIVCFILNIPRTMKFVAHGGPPTLTSLLAAVVITMISLGVAGPREASEWWKPQLNVTNNPGFRTIFNAILKMILDLLATLVLVQLWPRCETLLRTSLLP